MQSLESPALAAAVARSAGIQSRDEILDLLPDALFIVGSMTDGGRIRYANPRAAQLFGYQTSDLVGRSIEILIPQRFADQHRNHRRDYACRPRMRAMGAGLTLVGRRRDGTEFPVAVQLNGHEDAGDRTVIAIVRDVTEYVRMDQALTQARDLAVSANEVKSRFLAAASHDLRQPLQTIWSLQSILGRELAGTALAPHIAMLEDAVRGMDQMLSALIDINRLEQGAIQPVIRDFPLREILARLRSEFGYSAANKSLALEIEDSAEFARSDPALLLVVLRNLLGNAIKYTARGAVRVLVRVDGGNLCVDVHDSGPGIAPEHVGRVFEPFYQIDNPSRDQRQGVGLGLSIVQTICRLLAHTVTIDSNPGKGSRFGVQLPRGVASMPAAAAEAALPRAAATAASQGTTVLHIEDDPGVAKAIGMLLRLEGYEVIGAASRDEAILRVDGEGLRPGLILCDYQLPMGNTGDAILREIKTFLPVMPPTILLTGDLADKHLEKVKGVVDMILPKPVDVNLLLRHMAELLGQSKTTAA
ncbi:MAG: PAS domain S-box protein [Gammaproteobacteria bacterium]|nr:PAS domain S-box protein [Gammaproteobacteria bacterium]